MANNRTKKENIKRYGNRMLSVIKVSIELTTNGKKMQEYKFKLKIMNNEYYELIEYREDEEGMFCLGRRRKAFWCICAFVFTYHWM